MPNLLRNQREDLPQEFVSAWIVITELCNGFYSLSAGVLKFYDVININRIIKPEDVYVSTIHEG